MPEGAPAWGFEVLDFALERELPHIKSFVDRTSALALVAGKLALADAGLLEREKRPAGQEIGCTYGTMFGCLEAMTIFWNKIKTSNPKFAQPLPFTHGYANSPSSLLCIEYGLRGPAATFSGERLAGVEAVLFAYDQIAAGAGEIVLAGASESLTLAVYNHLRATGQLSPGGMWDEGTVPGEGAAMLVLESLDSAQRRSAKVLAEVTGVELRADGPLEADSALLLPTVYALRAHMTPQTAFACDHYAGDTFSASPLLAAAVAASLLGGRYALASLPRNGGPGRPVECRSARAVGVEPGTNVGLISLRQAEK